MKRKQVASIFLSAMTASVALNVLAGPDEGLVWAFKAKDGVADGSTDMADFRDQLTVSASSTQVFRFADDGVHRPFMTNLTVKSGTCSSATSSARKRRILRRHVRRNWFREFARCSFRRIAGHAHSHLQKVEIYRGNT